MEIIDGWVTSAKACPSPNFNTRPEGRAPELLVIHNISLPPKQFGGGYIEAFFQNRLDHSIDPYFGEIVGLEVSSHFLISRTGALTQFVSCEDRAWHAGESSYCGEVNCNDFSIGIELEGADDIAYTSEQYECLVSLTAALFEHYPQMASSKIAGHSDIAPGRKTDPGQAFDWQRYKTALTDAS